MLCFFMERYLEYLQEAERTIKIADHMLYVTFSLVKDKNLLLKILTEIKKTLINCVNSILQYEYLYKRVSLYKNPEENFRTFESKCAQYYNINKEEIKSILELLNITKKHEESPFEFLRGDKVIILSENSSPHVLTIEKTKKFLELAKNILKKTKTKIAK